MVIRADGGSAIGMGHVVRTLALAEILRDNYQIQYAIQQPDDNIKQLIAKTTNNIIELPPIPNFEIDVQNLIALCRNCHGIKTASENM